MQFKETIDTVVEELEKLDEKREVVIQLTRKLNRTSGRGIAHIIRKKEYASNLEIGRKIIIELSQHMEELAPVTSWGLTGSGTEEYAEFEILHAITQGKSLPTPKELSVPSWIWIAAIGDCIGELRRLMLASLIEGDLEAAKVYLENIQELYDAIIGLDFSKSLVPSLRRKVDIARTLIDRCESDFANAVINKRTKTIDE